MTEKQQERLQECLSLQVELNKSYQRQFNNLIKEVADLKEDATWLKEENEKLVYNISNHFHCRGCGKQMNGYSYCDECEILGHLR